MFNIGGKEVLKVRSNSDHEFPLVFSKEGQEYLGVHIASIKSKGFKCDYHYHVNHKKIYQIEYFDGFVGFLKSSGYKVLGIYCIVLIHLAFVNKD